MKTEAISRTKIPAPGEEVRVTLLPTFDYEIAEAAKNDTDRLGIDTDLYPSVTVAANLAYYNFRSSPSAEDKSARKVLDMRLGQLCRTEQESSENPYLPTIGIEIETPKLPFHHHRGIFPSDYRLFFDKMEMPRNSVNQDYILDAGDVEYWEFSPDPSHSPAVQTRIISELIQGRFIPSLFNSQSPECIEKYLDPHLISMHINIGIPLELPTIEYDILTEMKNLGVALAIAYSSGKRLEMRKMKNQNFVIQKAALQTSKSNEFPMLLELKAMELRTALSYQAMYTTQLLFASLFDSRIHPESPLSQKWKTVFAKIQDFLIKEKYTPDPTQPTETSYEVARIAQRGVGPEIKGVLENSARKIKGVIHSSGSQSPQKV